MYEKYFLEKEQLDIISNWSHKNEPLFICGHSGSGKTSLAKEILQDRVITHVDSLYMKNNTDIYEYIQNIIQKRNITMMFEQKKEKRGLLIDDIDIFYKHDKKIFKSIINLLSSKLYDTKVILTSSIKFLNNRSLNKLSYSRLFLVYDNHKIHKICKNICSEKNINLSLIKKQELIKRSSNNINTLISLLTSVKQEIITSELDNYDEEEILYENLFKKNYKLKDLVRIYTPNKTKISLDLLENIFDMTDDIKVIKNIYDYYSLSDIFETRCINYYEIQEYDTILTIYNFYSKIKSFNLKNKNFIPNKYISKSLIHVYSLKMNHHNDLIYFYLYLVHTNTYNKNTINELLRLDKNTLNVFIKTFNFYYNGKIKCGKIYKLLDK
jgi:hypothetical protein